MERKPRVPFNAVYCTVPRAGSGVVATPELLFPRFFTSKLDALFVYSGVHPPRRQQGDNIVSHRDVYSHIAFLGCSEHGKEDTMPT